MQNLGKVIRWINPKRALIFGSAVEKGLVARDLDLLILADLFNRYLWEDRPELLKFPKGPIYDVRLFTPEEFEVFYPLGSPIRQSIDTKNIDLKEYYV